MPKGSGGRKIHQMDHKLKVDFQLLEHRLSHHRECLETLMRNVKSAMRFQNKPEF